MGGLSPAPTIGHLFEWGLGVIKDYEQAATWYRKAAEHGDASGGNQLGTLYCKGLGVVQDCEQAAAWFRKAAEQGDARAASHLGLLYYKGLGVVQDYEQAVHWYRKAAEQGNACAKHNLGVAYDKGQGVPQDYAEAALWYRKAAEQGDPDAQSRLLLMKRAKVFHGTIFKRHFGIAKPHRGTRMYGQTIKEVLNKLALEIEQIQEVAFPGRAAEPLPAGSVFPSLDCPTPQPAVCRLS